MTETDHATALIQAFVVPGRRDRYLRLLSSDRGRAKLRASLAHFRNLDPRYTHKLPPGEYSEMGVARLLRSRGAPARCVLLCEDVDLDGLELVLEDALAAVVGRGMGTFVSCVPGRLAYFEGEEVGERYLLERTS